MRNKKIIGMNLPTVLTVLRILLIPVFVLLFILPVDWARLACTVVFAIAALTDWLDGYLARRWNQTSALGAFLDPVADKLMVSTALVMLVMDNPNLYFTLAVNIIVGREITISALREWMAELGQRSQVKVAMLGKIKTTMQMTALLLLIFRDPLPYWPFSAHQMGEWALGIAAFLTLWSMVAYIRAAIPYLKHQSED